jgi:outer membrane protein
MRGRGRLLDRQRAMEGLASQQVTRSQPKMAAEWRGKWGRTPRASRLGDKAFQADCMAGEKFEGGESVWQKKLDGRWCVSDRKGTTVKWTKIIRASAMTVLCGACSAGLWGQTNAANGGAAGTKVAAINMQAAIANTAEGKQAAAQLEAEFTPRRKELEDLNKQINDIQQRLSSSSDVLSEDEKERLTLKGQRLTQQLDRKQSELQEDLNDAQNEVITRIGRKLMDVLRKYAPSNGYAAVLDDSSQTTPVMYASTDITEQIVRLYDQTYPVKSAADAGDPKPVRKADTKPGGKPSDR